MQSLPGSRFPTIQLEEGVHQLHHAARRGDLATLNQLLDSRVCRVDHATTQPYWRPGWTALFFACSSGHDKCVQELIARGADINKIATHDGSTPLVRAAEAGHAGCVKLLLAFKANQFLPAKSTVQALQAHAIDFACLSGHAAVAALLDPAEFSSLHSAVMMRDLGALRMALTSGAAVDVRATCVFQWTSLHLACLFGFTECARLLLEFKANPDKVDFANQTVANLGIRNNHWHRRLADLFPLPAKASQLQAASVVPAKIALSSPSVLVAPVVGALPSRKMSSVVQRRLSDSPETYGGNATHPLLRAARNGDLERLKEQLNLPSVSAELQTKDVDSFTSLHLACLGGHLQCVEALLAKHAYIDAPCANGTTPLMVAAMNNKVQCAQLLLANRADASIRADKGAHRHKTALEIAKSCGFIDVIGLFETVAWKNAPVASTSHVSRRSSASSIDPTSAPSTVVVPVDHELPIHKAAVTNDLKTLRYELDRGVPMDARSLTWPHQTALQLACEFGHALCAQHLLERNAQVDIADFKGRTPLISATSNSRLTCTQLLLTYKANLSLRDDEHHTALDVAQGARIVAALGDQYDREGYDVRGKDKNGCDRRGYDDRGFHRLHHAVKKGDIKLVRSLLDKRANLDLATESDDCLTPLLLACSAGQLACAKELLDRKADVNKTSSFRMSSLFGAAFNGHLDCIDLLLTAKADLFIQGTEFLAGKTALDMAKDRKAVAVVPKLETAEKKLTTWIHDSQALSCMVCDSSFGVFSRRHHCRWQFCVHFVFSALV